MEIIVILVFCFSALASVEANIEIGDNVLFASNVLVTNENHGINPESTTPYMDQKLSAQDVKIGNGCWIGEKVSILSGVTIGEKCIIGAAQLLQNLFRVIQLQLVIRHE